MRKLVLITAMAALLSACAPATNPAERQFKAALELPADKAAEASQAFAQSARWWAARIKAGEGDCAAQAFNASQAWQLAGDQSQAQFFALLARVTDSFNPKIAAWYQELRGAGAGPEESLAAYGWIYTGRPLWTIGGSLILLAALLGALLAWQQRRRRPWLRPFSGLSAAVFIGLLLWSGIGPLVDTIQPVVMVDKTLSLHQGDSSAFPAVEPEIKAGSPARVLESRAHWLRIRSAGGVEGWVAAEHCRRLADLLP